MSGALILAGFVPRPQDLLGGLLDDRLSRIADFLDGTSSTILVAENAGRSDYWRAGRRQSGRAPGGGGSWADPNSRYGLHGYTADGLFSPGPCAINCTNDQEIYGFHPGGAAVLFADGSVRFLAASTRISVVAALITRAGGEVVSP